MAREVVGEEEMIRNIKTYYVVYSIPSPTTA